jgi:hypothetical protein
VGALVHVARARVLGVDIERCGECGFDGSTWTDGGAGEEWTATASVGDDQLDARWIARHAVHDARHHLLDVQRLREALRRPPHE